MSRHLGPHLLRVAVVWLVALAVFPGVADARTKPSSPQPLTLQQEVWSYSSNPAAPANCLNEDDYHYRDWAGSLSGSFASTELLCNYATDGWSAGGVGLEADLWVTGTFGDLSITAPDGTARHAVLMSQTKLKGGAVQSYYAVCVMPLFFLSSNTGTNPLEGGTWTMTLTGQATVQNYEVRAIMGYPDQQQLYCPPSQQNLQP